ncbi:MAG: class I SAM-dependent methyltransferase [Candidatus Tectomicrobia bacterium]|nr:class I SAM-dependent methyltransferase [Candidatus Tectomicrobia bacterium]
MEDIKTPADNIEATANVRGYTFDLNTYWQDWVDAYDGVHHLADIGAAYGSNTIPALERARVVAMDIDTQHLEELHERTPTELRPHLETRYGKLPDGLNCAEASFSGILVSEVLHFLSPHEVQQAFQELLRLLVPGGRLVLTAISFYNLNTETQGLVPELQAKFRADVDATTFPGWFPDFSVGKSLIPEPYRAHVPDMIHFFSADQLCTLADRAGFDVELARMATPTSYPPYAFCNKYNKEQVGLIARKPRRQGQV